MSDYQIERDEHGKIVACNGFKIGDVVTPRKPVNTDGFTWFVAPIKRFATSQIDNRHVFACLEAAVENSWPFVADVLVSDLIYEWQLPEAKVEWMMREYKPFKALVFNPGDKFTVFGDNRTYLVIEEGLVDLQDNKLVTLTDEMVRKI